METHLFLATSRLSPTKYCSHKSIRVAHKQVRFSTIISHASISTPSRRLTHYSYKPSIWDYNYLQSLNNDFKVDKYKRRAEKLKKDVKIVFKNAAVIDNRLGKFQLIDDLQRLGLAYQFEEEIKKLLENLYITRNNKGMNDDLYATALEFRLFRQHGYQISQNTFNRFVNDKGCFKETLCDDVRGMLSLYEASYLSFMDENIMKEAWKFTAEAHKKWTNKIVETNLSTEVQITFELPFHWRSPRMEVRRFIDIYEKRLSVNPLLLELAKLDFNLLQGLHLEELQNLSRWWNNIGLSKKLGFARDRLVESFLWSVGISFEPQYELRRKVLTRAVILITIIDDIYDLYGTLDELELFTDAVKRWDINTLNQLPDYMKVCYVALYNFVNEIVYDILKDQDLDILPYLKKAWFDLVNTFLVEARWYYSGNKPTFEEYIKNGWISVSGPLVLLQAFVGTKEPISIEELEFLTSNQDILYWASSIFRLCNDLGTSKDELKRGDASKSIQCYMRETGVSEEVAREHMTILMKTTWEKVNKYCVAADSPLSRSFVEAILNLVRTSHCFYLDGDGIGVQDDQSINRVSALLFQPIPL